MLIGKIRQLRAELTSRIILWHQRRTIIASALFDADWYVARYPDALEFDGSPLDHFLIYGTKEHRAPGPKFDPQSYLVAHPDVASKVTNPLLHFIRRGKKRGDYSFSGNPIAGANSALSFSVVVIGGAAPEITATLKGLKHQGGVSLEVITVSSDDHSKRQIEPFRRSQDRSGLIVKEIIDPKPANLRAAIEAAEHEFIVLVEAGDVLVDNALKMMSDHIRENDCDLLYADEAWITNSSAPPILKPAWSPELLTSYDYFGHGVAIRRTRALEALPSGACPSGQRPIDVSAAVWDLKLRVTELTQVVDRLPTILCRRPLPRHDDVPTLISPQTQSHSAVLTSYWKRQGIVADVRACADGTYSASWTLSEQPLVSIIIPNKNRAHLLRVCADGLFTKTDYKNFELIIVDNNSTEPDTIALYDELTRASIKLVRFDEEFNYSRACNLGAAEASGDLLLFLNNDIEVTESDWLGELVRQVMRPGVGIVGPKLLYPDGAIQHAGVAIGLFTLAAHVFHRAPHNQWGSFGSPDTRRNWMAVTGACQLVRRTVFDLVNGYDESFIISYSDVVFCLDVGKAGFRTVYVPTSVLTHHEGASRGHSNPANDQVLFARRLRALGISFDPFFHPSIDTQSFIPQLGGEGAQWADPTPLQTDIEIIGGGRSEREILDIYDDGAVASAVGWPWEAVAVPLNPATMKPSLQSAAWIILSLIRRRRDLRLRFPKALSEGSIGAYAVWVKTDGLKCLGLGPECASWIDAAFVADMGAKARQYLLHNEAFRRDEPLFLLPNGRVPSCSLLFEAVAEGRLDQEQVWWFLVESAEDPLRELLTTWAMTPLWQEKVPAGGTVFGRVELVQWVSETFGITQDWLFAQDGTEIMSGADQVRLGYAATPAWRNAFPDALTNTNTATSLLQHVSSRASGTSFLARQWHADQDIQTLAQEVTAPGLNILGHFAYPSGLRISTESIVAGLRANDMNVNLRDVPVSLELDDPIGHKFVGCETYDTTLIHVQPEPLFNQVYQSSGLLPRRERTYRIGYWYWEFDTIPTSWNRAALECDELWTASEFVAEGLRQNYRQPVNVFFPGIEIPSFPALPRCHFGIDDDRFIFLFVFHMRSIMERKNPLGLISAFKKAFGPKDKTTLVIKTSFGDQHPEEYEQLKQAAAGADILLIDKTFCRDETLALFGACDAYVSLHRSEGLGLSMAEAMLLGKPAIATRYSGNLEFMNDNNSLLVDYKLVSLNRDFHPYKAGQRWAEPSVAHAAAHMRKLYDDPSFARALGARAKEDLSSRLNYRAAGHAMKTRLAEIASMF